jgi:formate hydrogenlyase subunit 3/multisubunit Na+/H+ antiporter MnhD subunit
MLIGMGILAAGIIFTSIFPGLVLEHIVYPATDALINQAAYVNGIMGGIP